MRKLKDEVVLTVDATLVNSQTANKTLFLGRANSKWDGDLSYVWETDSGNANYGNFTLIQLKPNGVRNIVPKIYNSQPVYYVDGNGQIFLELS